MLNEAHNRERVADWLRRADVLPNWPLSEPEAIDVLRAVEYDATPERAGRFAAQHPDVAPVIRGGSSRWNATALVGFASWLESRRLWLPGAIHLHKKNAVEVEFERGTIIDDMEVYDIEDLIRFIATTNDPATRIGLALGLEVKLGIRRNG